MLVQDKPSHKIYNTCLQEKFAENIKIYHPLQSELRFSYNGLPRSCLVVTPRHPRALLLFLHGRGADSALAAAETRWFDWSDKKDYVIVIPDALPVHVEQPPKFLSNPRRWHDGSDYYPNEPYHDDVGFLDEVIDRLQQLLGRSLPLLVSGFSNGAGMTFRLAQKSRHAIVAIAPVAGFFWCWDEPLPRIVPTFYLVGDSDPLFPLAGGFIRTPWAYSQPIERMPVWSNLRLWAQKMSLDLPDETSKLRSFYHDSLQIEIVPGLGHHWPGGRGLLNPRIAGPNSQALHANERICQFFEEILGRHGDNFPEFSDTF